MMKKDLKTLLGGLNDHDLDEAILHLQEVLRHSEASTLTILEAATSIQSAAPNDADISNSVTSIYDACTFQDVSGQRVKRVITLLDSIKNMLGDAPAALPKKQNKKPSREELMSGPQLPDDTPSQEMIDKMFSDLK